MQPGLSLPCHLLPPARAMVLSEDVLQCTTAELSYGLCCFVNEVKRPNGEPYSPDSLFYLCLGIQQVRGSASRLGVKSICQFSNPALNLKSHPPTLSTSSPMHSICLRTAAWRTSSWIASMPSSQTSSPRC